LQIITCKWTGGKVAKDGEGWHVLCVMQMQDAEQPHGRFEFS
jgi:hypothetical protein